MIDPSRLSRDKRRTIRHYQLEGLLVGRSVCLQCRHTWTAVVSPETDGKKLECPACHFQRTRFVEFSQVGQAPPKDDDEGEDWKKA